MRGIHCSSDVLWVFLLPHVIFLLICFRQNPAGRLAMHDGTTTFCDATGSGTIRPVSIQSVCYWCWIPVLWGTDCCVLSPHHRWIGCLCIHQVYPTFGDVESIFHERVLSGGWLALFWHLTPGIQNACTQSSIRRFITEHITYSKDSSLNSLYILILHSHSTIITPWHSLSSVIWPWPLGGSRLLHRWPCIFTSVLYAICVPYFGFDTLHFLSDLDLEVTKSRWESVASCSDSVRKSDLWPTLFNRARPLCSLKESGLDKSNFVSVHLVQETNTFVSLHRMKHCKTFFESLFYFSAFAKGSLAVYYWHQTSLITCFIIYLFTYLYVTLSLTRLTPPGKTVVICIR